jgi:hypothetical protein
MAADRISQFWRKLGGQSACQRRLELQAAAMRLAEMPLGEEVP